MREAKVAAGSGWRGVADGSLRGVKFAAQGAPHADGPRSAMRPADRVPDGASPQEPRLALWLGTLPALVASRVLAHLLQDLQTSARDRGLKGGALFDGETLLCLSAGAPWAVSALWRELALAPPAWAMPAVPHGEKSETPIVSNATSTPRMAGLHWRCLWDRPWLPEAVALTAEWTLRHMNRESLNGLLARLATGVATDEDILSHWMAREGTVGQP